MCEAQVYALCQEWIASKNQEKLANAKRIEIENKLIQLAKSDIPTEGSAKLGDLKVSTGFTRTWDTDILTQIYRKKPEVFPFKVEWKEDRRLTSKLESNSPEIMAIYAEALTIKTRKPSFSLIGE